MRTTAICPRHEERAQGLLRLLQVCHGVPDHLATTRTHRDSSVRQMSPDVRISGIRAL